MEINRLQEELALVKMERDILGKAEKRRHTSRMARR